MLRLIRESMGTMGNTSTTYRTCLAILIGSVLTLAHRVPAVQAQLPGPVVRFSCDFPGISGKLDFVYDTERQKGIVIATTGTGNIEAYSGPDAWSFFELLGTGSVQVTVISRDGAAIHSRHTLRSRPDGLEFIPSLVSGRCKRQ